MSKIKSREKWRDRKFCLLLYPEDQSHVNALEKIKSSYDYAYILHNKDINDDGEIKKEHYHVVLRTGNNAVWQTALAKELGITDNYIEPCRNIDRALEYLIHYNEPEKYQYDVDEVHGNLKGRLVMNISKSGKSESEKVVDLMDAIESSKEEISYISFSKYCASVGMWDVYRRAQTLFIKMIDEHNLRIRSNSKNN